MSGPAQPTAFFAALGSTAPRRSLTDGWHCRVAGPARLWSTPAAESSVPENTVVLSKVCRDTRGTVPLAEIDEQLRRSPQDLVRLQPPFGAVHADGAGVTMVADSMGFQQLFHTDPEGSGAPVMSSSALLAGQALHAPLDRVAVAVQSLLGWQLGQRTLFEGVRKLEPGAVGRLGDAGLQITPAAPARRAPITLDRAVSEAATLLRASLNAVLDDHPDAVLQLTGGMDSRLLLSAVPENRRRGLRVMTLAVPGSADVAVARALSERYGMRHDVHGLADIQQIEPESAWARCVAESSALDAMADPVALSAQRIAEQAFEQGVRISGLGGEVARGFYYLGRVRERGYSRADVDRLASWRMFVNDAVETDLLAPDFAAWARDTAQQEVYAAMRDGGPEWFRAADELYLRHRMQRWAGATDTAVADRRIVINPMLDAGFLDIAARLRPADKARSRFLARLQMELDPELGRVPLDNRPAPAVYADPPRWQSVLDAVSLGNRVARKALQRVRHGNRPPAGGDVMAAKVVQHWRDRPEIVDPLRSVDLIDPGWLDRVLGRSVEPRPSSVALLTNLIVALEPDRQLR
ncbi:asparagine synthase-related protein [Cumulibacter manganitolerans]|uniref:asparagine synthase-related protein n=1 Tax=Cumulibacter manganitolerans TaxID=1884992 RepID=UPI00129635DE|nr:asparagine synthase-related protein [Cumulibacter manganitolerans]